MTQITRRAALAGLALGLAAPALAQRERDYDVPFVPTPHALVQRMLDLAGIGAGQYLIDLGCGDGRIAVAAAQRGARALGVDIDANRIAEAAGAARVAGVESRTVFRRQDLFATPIAEADVVALYLLPAINLRLRPRLLTDLRPGARVVSHAFDMGDWTPDVAETVEGRRLFLWVVPAVADGSWGVTGADGSYRLLEVEQRFQMLTATLSGGGENLAMTGRLDGTRLQLAAAGSTLRYDGRVEGDRIVPISGSDWEAVRS